MTYPSGVSETEFLAVVEHVGGILAPQLRYWPHTVEDVKQMVAVDALEALPRFRPEAGRLGAFLYRHCRNRLINRARDELGWRTDSPCRACHEASLGRGPGHEDGSICESFSKWMARSRTRTALSMPSSIDHSPEDWDKADGDTVESTAEFNELTELIDTQLPAELRSDYLRLRDGVALPTNRKRAVQQAIAELLSRSGYTNVG